jgi:hypothetical protein
MLVHEYAAQTTVDAHLARQNSLSLWRSLETVSGKRSAAGEAPPCANGDERLALRLTGRYRVGDGNEFPCEFVDLSPQGLRLRGPKSGALYKWCTASITSIGLVEGLVVEARESSFVVGVIAPPRRLQRLAQRLHWQALRNAAKVQERRASERIEMNNASGTIETEDGRTFSCEVYDLSDGGAALQLGANALYFWENQAVRFGERFGRVLRHFPGGLVIKFD